MLNRELRILLNSKSLTFNTYLSDMLMELYREYMSLSIYIRHVFCKTEIIRSCRTKTFLSVLHIDIEGLLILYFSRYHIAERSR